MIHIRVQSEPLDAGAEQTALRQCGARVGALAIFVGLTRDPGDGDPGHTSDSPYLYLEHYPGMTETALAAIAGAAAGRWPLDGIRIVHRVGRLIPGEPIVFVGVASRHRSPAFRACEFLIDRLKTDAPFWKKEGDAAGARWVDARAADERAARRWMEADKPAPGIDTDL